MLPAFSHTVEFTAHYAHERFFYDVLAATKDGVTRQRTFAISVIFSVISVLFNLYAMRKGALLVGAGEATQSLKKDMMQMPRLVSEFVIALPVLISRFIESGKLHYALGVFVSFGILVGAILGAARGKWQWGWRSALGSLGTFAVCNYVGGGCEAAPWSRCPVKGKLVTVSLRSLRLCGRKILFPAKTQRSQRKTKNIECSNWFLRV